MTNAAHNIGLQTALRDARTQAGLAKNMDAAVVLDVLREHLAAGTVDELARLIEEHRRPLASPDLERIAASLGPSCDHCGGVTVDCGTCYRCFGCGNAMALDAPAPG